MTNRELDAAIAEALGEVEANAPIGDGLTRTETVYARSMEDANEQLRKMYPRSLGTLRPAVYIGPAYSTDPVAADALMRALRERGLCIVLDIDERPAATVMREEWAGIDVFEATGDTWTLALAKAALRALTGGEL